jgi:hypothetical protein
MDDSRKVVHYYHANGDAFGGFIEKPFELTLPVLASSSLPSVGGYTSARHENFRVGEVISIDRAYTQVAGSQDRETGSFDTLVTAVIEGLNIGNVFFAERLAVQITTHHPVDSYFPKVSFSGTEFRGLRVNECELAPNLRLDICDRDGDPDYPKRPYLSDPKLLGFAREQSKKLADLANGDEAKKQPVFQRLLERHRGEGLNGESTVRERGNVIVSVVDGINTTGHCEGATVGHVLSIPDFGRVALGELVVNQNAFDLTLLRVDLGCVTKGKQAGPHGGANGTNSGGN